jgi:hypothetical protein
MQEMRMQIEELQKQDIRITEQLGERDAMVAALTDAISEHREPVMPARVEMDMSQDNQMSRDQKWNWNSALGISKPIF